MRLRHPWLIKTASFSAAWLLRAWVGSLSIRYRPLGPNLDPRHRGFRGRYIYCFWHENMLLPGYLYGRRDIRVLISNHADGQLIAEVCHHLGFRTVRGSTTRGGVEAMRRMVRHSSRGHLAITPDGPQGPRRRVQPGLVYLAARTGLPVVPIGIAYDRPWRMHSWDRFALPRPGSRGAVITSHPITLPADLGRHQLEHYRLLVEEELARNTAAAENWVETGKWVDPDRLARPAGPLAA